uniref:Abi family protein n=1 Tax=Ensifer adhaerens TaxID=106592 RepID=UPI003F499F28
MAESQYPCDYEEPLEKALTASLSPARVGRYLVRAGFDFALAMDFYLWNARLAKSLQYPLHMLEVTLRNAVNEHLSLLEFPSDWVFDHDALASLGALNSDIIVSLNKSKSRLLWGRMSGKDHRQQVINPNHQHVPSFGLIDTNDVIASMSFEFWLALLDREFENKWHPTFRRVFPNVAANEYRSTMWTALQPLKDVRNRIAHHEPVLDLKSLHDVHSSILSIIAKRCEQTSQWVKDHSTFNRVWHDTPQKSRKQGRRLLDIAIKVDHVTADTANIEDLIVGIEAMKRRAAIVYSRDGELGVLVAEDITRYLRLTSEYSLAELAKTLDAVLTTVVPKCRVALVGEDATTNDARKLFFDTSVPSKKRPDVVLITKDGTHAAAPLGLVFKPDYN